MKNSLFPLLFILFTAMSSFAQEEDMTEVNVHEIGVDVSPLLQTAFGAGNVGGGSSPYTLIYRYHLERWALRAGIGGFYSDRSGTINDSISEEIKNKQLLFRLGLERKWDFSQRWQFFYGLDFRARFAESQRNLESNTGWSSDFFLDESTAYGVSPFLGFRFRINQRLSLTTQSSIWIFYNEQDSQRLRMPYSSQNQVHHAEGWETAITPPTSLFLTLHF